LGEQRITSLDDANKPARAMKARFEFLRDAELASYAWRFAVKRTRLAASTTVPEWGYSLVFPRPVDDLRLLRVEDAYIDFRTFGVQFEGSLSRQDQTYQIIGGNIETNLPAPLKYEYVRKVENTGEWDALFSEAFACRLAMDACEELTQSNQKLEAVTRQYLEAIAQARRVNALYAPPRKKPMGSFMQSRAY
jgi:hypothetical protein